MKIVYHARNRRKRSSYGASTVLRCSCIKAKNEQRNLRLTLEESMLAERPTFRQDRVLQVAIDSSITNFILDVMMYDLRFHRASHLLPHRTASALTHMHQQSTVAPAISPITIDSNTPYQRDRPPTHHDQEHQRLPKRK